ncbi:phosphoglycerate mutase family protein [Streptococcus porcinus]|nr:phosphoglycerate mutase family protein [Streptococcus porcinus]
MTTPLYFIRHAEPNYGNHNDRLRKLSDRGVKL